MWNCVNCAWKNAAVSKDFTPLRPHFNDSNLHHKMYITVVRFFFVNEVSRMAASTSDIRQKYRYNAGLNFFNYNLPSAQNIWFNPS